MEVVRKYDGTHLPLDRNARIVGNFVVGARKGVKERGLSAVRVSYECYCAGR